MSKGAATGALANLITGSGVHIGQLRKIWTAAARNGGKATPAVGAAVVAA
jgi:hypothetical protein